MFISTLYLNRVLLKKGGGAPLCLHLVILTTIWFHLAFGLHSKCTLCFSSANNCLTTVRRKWDIDRLTGKKKFFGNSMIKLLNLLN